MANRNPNNWHWVDKNCLPWAKDYLGRELANVEVTGANGARVKTLEVTRCEGDVDLNQRKGKVITLFDLTISINWSGSLGDVKARGTIEIPEIAHDTEESEYVFDISVESESRDKAPIKETARKELTPLLRRKLAAFAPSLIEAHAKDIQYDQQVTNLDRPTPSTTQTIAQFAATARAPLSELGFGKMSGGNGQILNTTTLTETVEFVAPPHDMYEVFLDPERVRAWTRAGVQVSRELGSSFSLFDGNVTGKILNLEYDKMIVQSWRLKSWPEGHYSTVTLTLSPSSDSTAVNLKQEGVPVGEVDSVRQNWKNYYWKQIKATFGYGAVF